MRTPFYDHNAKRKTVSVTLNADLVARSAAHGINISRVAEAALIAAFETAEKDKDPRGAEGRRRVGRRLRRETRLPVPGIDGDVHA